MDFPIYDEIKSEDRFFYVRIEIYLKMPQKFRKFVPMYALSKESRAVMTHLPELIYFVRKENYLFMINTLTSNDNFYYYAFKKIEKNIFVGCDGEIYYIRLSKSPKTSEVEIMNRYFALWKKCQLFLTN